MQALLKTVANATDDASETTYFFTTLVNPTGNGTVAYVNFGPNVENDSIVVRGYEQIFWGVAEYLFNHGHEWVTSAGIYLLPLFFRSRRSAQVDTIVHELGRYWDDLDETNPSTWSDVYEWDNIINSLIEHKDEIIKLDGEVPDVYVNPANVLHHL